MEIVTSFELSLTQINSIIVSRSFTVFLLFFLLFFFFFLSLKQFVSTLSFNRGNINDSTGLVKVFERDR